MPTLFFIAVFSIIASWAGTAVGRTAAELRAQRARLADVFRQECEAIIQQPEFGGDQQAITRILEQTSRPANANLLFLPGHQFGDHANRNAALSRLTEQYAAALARLAERALDDGHAAASYQLLHQAAYYDPEQALARAVLGLAQRGEDAAPRVSRATTNHPRLPWRRKRYWRIRSEHYQIVTNGDQDAGIDLARRLEALHAVWRQLFFDCWSDPDALRSACRQTRALARPARGRHRVVLFATREQYVEYLRTWQPRIDITLGFYDPTSQTSYFFASPDASATTQNHEAAHQLFQELQPASPDAGLHRNFWILEGIALYLESFRRRGPCAVVGGWSAERLQYARYRCLREDFHVPPPELVQLGRDALQQDPRIRKLYSQSAGLAHLLMDGVGGAYRQGLIEYLRLIYQGRDRPDQLAFSCGVSWDELDRQYRRFLNVTDQELLQSRPRPNSMAALCLGRTAVTDRGLLAVGEQNRLEWIDLAYLPVSDEGTTLLSSTTRLRQLNLEGTSISDATLARLVDLRQLRELDLSHTNITDNGVAYLAGLSELRGLWLAGTRITDASLEVLRQLRNLERLDVSGTNVTQQGRTELRMHLPRLSAD